MNDRMYVAQACYDAGFRDAALETAVAIAIAETNCDPDYTLVSDTEHCVGVFRFDLRKYPELTEELLRDARSAALQAYYLFRMRGFAPWATFAHNWRGATFAHKWRIGRERGWYYVGEGHGDCEFARVAARDLCAHIVTNGSTLSVAVDDDGVARVVDVGGTGRALDVEPNVRTALTQAYQFMQYLQSQAADGLTGTPQQRTAIHNMVRAFAEWERVQ